MKLLPVLAASLVMSSAALAAGNVEETAQICRGATERPERPQEKTTPIIWGQNEGYLYLQLRDFKKGSRKSDIMGPVAELLEKDDMKALAAYFTKKEWPDLQQPSAPDKVAATARADNSVDRMQGLPSRPVSG